MKSPLYSYYLPGVIVSVWITSMGQIGMLKYSYSIEPFAKKKLIKILKILKKQLYKNKNTNIQWLRFDNLRDKITISELQGGGS